MKKRNISERLFAALGAVMLGMLLANPAFAQLSSQASTILNQVSAALTAIGVVTCTIAIMWAGFKMLFQHVQFGDIAKIFIGAILIGGASTMAGVLLS
ncbi:TrbC/VirB2 family protein [Burkholderia pyrrocinia]|uniref:TrbC/VirB2 family protein n=1 Tax=Burkholderia pyrrocinia TaxID=60550 RepID=UPI001BD1723F|nr:TrbC/VirB2 family protein [Burkholderia pyrrocinia]QVN18976.1 TrbC/VirB2 family protein [Burkholderia pyrrocinia]